MNVPEDCKYSSDHEWIRAEENNRFRVGITDYAQDAMGDVVFVELPTLSQVVKTGDSLCEVESTKSVSEVYAPMAGVVVEVNSDLADSPEQINADPYGDGWIYMLEAETAEGFDALLSAASYQELTEGQ